jgi:NodT family efflux transporter outer membrane factor (OMF) lipoprotein
MSRKLPRFSRLMLVAVGPLLAACTVGPDFQKPAAPPVGAYTKPALATQVEGPRLVMARDIPADWWTLFHSAPLDALIRQAMQQNPDLAAAQASLRMAMENVKAQSAAFYPTVSGGLDASRNRQGAQLSPVLASSQLLYSLYQTQAVFSWTPDLWGGNRRSVEALQAEANAQNYQLQATHVALAANVTAAAIQEASLCAQIDATQTIIQDERNILAIERKQHTQGQIAGQDIAAQETVLAQAEESLAPLQKQLAQQRDLLTQLAGRYPADEIEQTFRLDELSLPQELPVSLPAQLVAQRADIRVAEENLHAASAQIGVAVAARLPNITLSANAGNVATQLGQLFGPGNGFWAVGAGLSQPVFDGGQLAHREDAAKAGYDLASAQYRGIVLAAFRDVADTLQAIHSDSEAVRLAGAAQTAAGKSLSLARAQWAAGQVARLALLNAEIADQQARLATIAARAGQLADAAALMQALGGGWWKNGNLGKQA